MLSFQPQTLLRRPVQILARGQFQLIMGFARYGGFQKGGFGGCSLDPQKPERGTKNGTAVPKTVQNTNDGTQNRNEGILQNRSFLASRS